MLMIVVTTEEKSAPTVWLLRKESDWKSVSHSKPHAKDKDQNLGVVGGGWGGGGGSLYLANSRLLVSPVEWIYTVNELSFSEQVHPNR